MSEKQKLRRSRNQVISGVCAGFAEYAGLNPGLVRLMYMFGSVASFLVPGLVLYLVCYLLMAPPEGDPQAR
jgi:phage shock protein PspC (stress-responsive transcriptional regulator)